MNSAIGFYILSRAWNYLLSRPDYSRGDSDAMRIIETAKTAVIWDDETDTCEIDLLIEVLAWKNRLMPEEVLAEVL